MNKNILLVAVLVVVGAGGAYLFLVVSRGDGPQAQGQASAKEMCPKHNVPESICPFCDKSLIAKLGHCAGHDVAEALCTRCNPALIPAFKAENDWCAGHNVPESQCTLCKAGQLPPGEKR